jgi:hypothetical protein
VTLTNPPQNVDQHRESTEANRLALEKVYAKYYRQDGTLKKPHPQRAEGKYDQALYDLLALGTAGYAKDGISKQNFDVLKAIPNSEITAQKMDAYERKLKTYQDAKAAYDANPTAAPPPEPTGPKSLDEALGRGDYFHIHNTAHPEADTKLKGRARRIIVNVKTQQDGLRVAGALAPLFTDPVVGPNFRQFKIYLSRAPQPDKLFKEDKLVVYYKFAGGSHEVTDKVGNRLAATIEGAVGEDAIVNSFAPFYSRLGRGMAWGEEPKYYLAGLPSGASYTESRTLMIERVLRNNPQVRDVDDFVDKVNQEFRASRVDPDRPQTHLLVAPKKPTKRGTKKTVAKT